jgi:rubrerythrin
MPESEGLTALEVLGVAIRSEVQAASLYARMSEQVGNRSLADKMRFLQHEEEKHLTILEREYRRRFPDIELQLPARSAVPSIDGVAFTGMNAPELFQLAMRSEQLAADFYSREAERSLDETGRTTLRYLSRVERGHYQMLEAEYELAARFPDYYNADDFHVGQELMHIGP